MVVFCTRELAMSGRVPSNRNLPVCRSWNAFPTGEQRESALRAIARHENLYDWQYWEAILVSPAIGCAWVAIRGLRCGRALPLSVGLGAVVGLAGHAILYRAVHRWAARLRCGRNWRTSGLRRRGGSVK